MQFYQLKNKINYLIYKRNNNYHNIHDPSGNEWMRYRAGSAAERIPPPCCNSLAILVFAIKAAFSPNTTTPPISRECRPAGSDLLTDAENSAYHYWNCAT